MTLSRIRCMAVISGLPLLGMLFLAVVTASAQTPAAPKVEVRGVRVVGPAYGKDMEGLRAFNWNEVSIALLVTIPEGGLVSVDNDNLQLTKLADDKGTDLKANEQTMIGGMHMGMPAQVSKDGKACLVEVNGEGVPAKGATAVMAAGTIGIQCGSKKETAKQANVALTPGTKFIVGPFAFEISKVGKPELFFDMNAPDAPTTAVSGEKFEVTLRSNQDCSNIVSILFLDASGKDLGAKASSNSSMGMPGMMTVEKSFVLPKKVDNATVVITYWADLKEVKVAFDVKATLGL